MADPSPPTPPLGRRAFAMLTAGGPPHFTVFGVPVRVEIWFWLVAFALGPHAGGGAIAAWLVIVFVSVLVHELGHALMARRFGAQTAITLHAFGGRTLYLSTKELSRKRRIAISLAGPGAGMLLGLLVLVVAAKGDVREIPTLFSRLFLGVMGAFLKGHPVEALPPALAVAALCLFVNVGWGLVNLLPVVPFDGGNVLAAALGPKHAYATALVSTTVGVAVAAWALSRGIGYLPMAGLFGFGAFLSFAQSRQARAGEADARAGLTEKLAVAKDALAKGEHDVAFAIGQEVLASAQTQPVKNGALMALAWAHVGRGEGVLARKAIEQIEPKGAVDPFTLAAVEDAAGSPQRALNVLLEARRFGLRAAEMSKLLIDLHAREGNLAEAVAVTLEDAELLSHEDARAVLEAALGAGEHERAAQLAARLFAVHKHPEDLLDEARGRLRAGDREGAVAALAQAVGAGVTRDTFEGDTELSSLMPE
jgi:Zn-dependent protease